MALFSPMIRSLRDLQIAEMYRLRWVIEMFFRTFKQLLGCRHLFCCDHNGVEIQACCAMIVCMLIQL